MHKEFIGRSHELAMLENAYKSKKSECIPLYGRRRVGKSELILHLIKNKPSIYFLGKKEPAQFQINEFLVEAARKLQQPILANVSTRSWKTAITSVMSQWKGHKKLILAFDEFQWTVQASPELPSILQEIWDLQWESSNTILLILCGSYIGFMEKEVLGKQSPLFGRRTGQIFLKPFAFKEASLFHPNYSLEDKAKTYFTCGGIPLYLRFFSANHSVDINIKNNFLDEFAPLYREADFLLREELREVEKYYGILFTLAACQLPAYEIAQRTGIDSRNLYYYLEQLIQLGYVSRRYPLTGTKPNAKNVRFAIEDPVLRFWFRFVYPNTSFITQMGKDASLKEIIKPNLSAYYGSCFEKLCREALSDIYHKEGVSSNYETGEYWDKQVQIDLVGYRQDNWTDIGECKWGSIKSAKSIIQQLNNNIGRYPNSRNATIKGRIFTRKKMVKAKQDTAFIWHSLEDIYN